MFAMRKILDLDDGSVAQPAGRSLSSPLLPSTNHHTRRVTSLLRTPTLHPAVEKLMLLASQSSQLPVCTLQSQAFKPHVKDTPALFLEAGEMNP
jgi:hypothetical protein